METDFPDRLPRWIESALRILAGRPATSPLSDAWKIAGAVAVLSALSWARLLVTGELNVDEFHLSTRDWLWFGPAFGAAWIVAGRAVLRVAIYGLRDLSPRRVILLGALVHAAALPAIPLTSNDIYNTFVYGRLAILGKNPYEVPPTALPTDDPFHATISTWSAKDPTAYGPVGVAFGIVAATAGSVPWALVISKLVVAGVVALALLIAARCASNKESERRASVDGLALFAWNPLLAWELTGQLHNDAFLVLGIVGFIAAARAGRTVAASAWLALGFCTKFAVVPVIGLYAAFLLRQDWKRATVAVLTVIILSAAAFAPFWVGPQTLDGPIEAMRPDTVFLTGSIAQLIFGRASPENPAPPSAAFTAWTVGVRVALLILAAVLALRVRTLADLFRAALIFTLAWLAIGVEWILPWYALWALPWVLVERSVRLRVAVAVYTAMIPWTYAPDGLERSLILPTALVHGLPVVLVVFARRRN